MSLDAPRLAQVNILQAGCTQPARSLQAPVAGLAFGGQCALRVDVLISGSGGAAQGKQSTCQFIGWPTWLRGTS